MTDGDEASLAPERAPPSSAPLPDPPHTDPESPRGNQQQHRPTAPGKKRRRDFGRKAYRNNRDEQLSKRFRPDPADDEAHGEPVEKEERKPKRKVAVMIGYCGTGYRGLQVNPPHRTIEADLFDALVRAGAISKANSDDPKKSSLNRCARTDKGVHAAGNVISLKLIIEDPDVIAKINSHLPPQIRVWDIIRTIGSFSAYDLCDSRKYEYLLPSHVFLPPHPGTYLAKQIRASYENAEDIAALEGRQKDVMTWWDETTRITDEALAAENIAADSSAVEQAMIVDPGSTDQPSPADNVLKMIRAHHLKAKRTYRISPYRLGLVRQAFQKFVGTINFHNYTVNKKPTDPSAQRHLKSFTVSDPILIDGTEWLAIKVHGQSFMMHQIRKMVGMVMMIVRTGCPLERVDESFGHVKFPIGKAPSLGLHLEYPLFDHYSEKTAKEHGREPLDFRKYEENIEAFKKEWIYEKIWEEEAKGSVYDAFVRYMDTIRAPTYLYLTNWGIAAVEEARKRGEEVKEVEPAVGSDDEGGDDGGKFRPELS